MKQSDLKSFVHRLDPIPYPSDTENWLSHCKVRTTMYQVIPILLVSPSPQPSPFYLNMLLPFASSLLTKVI